MKYTGPKFKLCRREGINLFGTPKYDIRKRKKLPGQHGGNMPRLSEYWKLLRNKQALKRMYLMSEKQFKQTVMDKAGKYSTNYGVPHDIAAIQFLESRLDSIVLRAGFAKTIMQARQIVWHGHFRLNWKKHDIPSYFVKVWDVIELKDKLKSSPLYSDVPIVSGSYSVPSWLKVSKENFSIEIIDTPRAEEMSFPVDVLKVIEFYARA